MLITTSLTPNGRGCGSRKQGAPYLCCGTGAGGQPIEAFILDPVQYWPGKFQRGIKILPRNPNDPETIYDVVVFVSKEDYPSPWDYVMECKYFGASRRVSPNTPFEKLTPFKSRMIFVHAHAVPEFYYRLNRGNPGDTPLKGCRFTHHYQLNQPDYTDIVPGYHLQPPSDTPHCTYALQDLAYLVHKDIEPVGDDGYRVQMPSFSYDSKYPLIPESDQTAQEIAWRIGVFLALPLTHIEYCDKPEEKSQERAKKAGFSTVTLDY